MYSKLLLTRVLACVILFCVALSLGANEVVLPEIEKEKLIKVKADKVFSLKDAVKQAMLFHPEIKRSQASIQFREEELRKGYASFYPSIDFHGELGRESSQSNALRSAGDKRSTLNRRDTNLTLRQLLWDGKNSYARKDRLESLLNQSMEENSSDKEEVSLRVVSAYLDLLRTEKLIRVAEENIKAHEEINELVQKRIEKNRARKSEEGQVKGRMALAKASLERQRLAYDTAVESFVEVVGFIPQKIEEEDLSDVLKPKNVQDALVQALDKHPSLRAVQHGIEAQRKSITEAKSTYQPQFYLRLSGEWNDNLDGFNGENIVYKGLIEVDWNLFRGGADRANVRGRYAALEEEKEERSRLLLAIRRDLHIAWNDHKSSMMDYKFFTEHADASLITMEAFEDEYKAAQRTLFDLLNSKAEYFSAMESVINARYSAYQNSYGIIHAMGVLSGSILESDKGSDQGSSPQAEAQVVQHSDTSSVSDSSVEATTTVGDESATEGESAESATDSE